MWGCVDAAWIHCLKPVLRLMNCPFPWLCIQLWGHCGATAGSARFCASTLLLLCAFVGRTDATSTPRTAQASHNGYTLQPSPVFTRHPCCYNTSSTTCSTQQPLHNPLLNSTGGKLIADLLILYNVGSIGAAHVRATLQSTSLAYMCPGGITT
jgi:hypothetical protein